MLPFLSLSTQHIKCQPTHVTPNDQFEEMARFGRAKMKRRDEDWYQRKRASMNKVVEEAEKVNNNITHYARNDDVDGLLYTLNSANKTLDALTIALKRDDTFTHAKRVLQVLKRNTTDAMAYCTTHLREQAQNNVVVFDIETVEIIQNRAHICLC